MSIWQELGIDADSDIKTIKRAYAKRVKVTRPEDDAAAFQRLHKAYKQALAIAKANAKRAAAIAEAQAEVALMEEPEQKSRLETEQEPDAEQELEPISEKYDEQALGLAPLTQRDFEPSEEIDLVASFEREAQKQRDAWNEKFDQHDFKELEPEPDQAQLESMAYTAELNRLSDQIRMVIQDITQRDQLKSWQFLLDSPYILAPDFNSDLACAVWHEIYQFKCEYVHAQMEANFSVSALNDAPINLATIAYLDELFNWETKLSYIAGQIGDEAAEALYEHVELLQTAPNHSSQAAAVRGGKGIKLADKTASPQPKAALVLKKQREAYRTIGGFLIILLILSLVLFITFFSAWFEQDGNKALDLMAWSGGLLAYIGFVFTAVLMKKAWGVYLSTTLAMPLLFAFPGGTIGALILLWHIPKAARYCKNKA